MDDQVLGESEAGCSSQAYSGHRRIGEEIVVVVVVVVVFRP